MAIIKSEKSHPLHYMKNVNFIINKDLFILFKKKCAENDISMTEVLSKFIKEYINNEKIPNS